MGGFLIGGVTIKKGVVSVIKNEGDNRFLLWKSPIEDFYNNSILIVSESEKAMFYNQGLIDKIYSAGRHSIDSSCFPISDTVLKKFTAGKSPFHCKLFFVNMTERIDLKWGTSSPIQIKDPEYNFIIGVKSNGVYSLAISEPKKFLLKLIGTNIQTLKFSDVGVLFREYFGTKIREFIHETIISEKISIFEIESKLSFLSEKIIGKLNLIVSEYGLILKKFSISEITIPQDDPNYKLINNAFAKKASIGIQGDTFDKSVKAEALLNYSKNEGIGGIPGALVTGFTVSKLNDDLSENLNQICCPSCGKFITSNSKFCCYCGSKVEEFVFCGKCGSKNYHDSLFCTKCGTKIRKE